MGIRGGGPAQQDDEWLPSVAGVLEPAAAGTAGDQKGRLRKEVHNELLWQALS
jgi:hypothetical protein